MFFTPASSKRSTLEKEGPKPSPFIPTVYEHFEEKPISWEYHVLNIDMAEQSLPSIQELNELGQQGWIMVSLLNEARVGKKDIVHYYFLRQTQ